MPSSARHDRWSTLLAIGLTLTGIMSRLIPHPWNATPIMAAALFSGTYLSTRWAIALPVAALAASDAILGWHATIPFTWGAAALTGLIGGWVRPRATFGRIATGSVAGSLAFFAITNFGVWLVGGLYPMTWEGFWRCYEAAIPFLRGTLLGDLAFTAVLFGSYALASGWRRAAAVTRA